jgi:hypothetical protein
MLRRSPRRLGTISSPRATCSKVPIFLTPDVLALEIAKELEAALEQFAAIAEDLKR